MNNQNSKVQILMSTYNGEKYLRVQMDSILNQSWKNLELLVRDDGSSDGTLQILHELQYLTLLKYLAINLAHILFVHLLQAAFHV